jgi:HK97 family phage major capsid protein
MPFARMGHFFQSVRECGTGMSVERSPQMAKYLEQSTNWHKSYQQKMIAQYGMKAAPLGMNETIGADGGFLVPPQFVQQLLMRAYDNDLLGRTTLFPMTGPQLKIPAVNETSRVDGSRFGGVLAYWEGEAQQGVETKPSYDQITLNLSKLFLLIRATDEILADWGALETFIDTMASEELTFRIGDAIVNGSGNNMPLGILQSPALVVVPKETGQTLAANPLVPNNIVKMWAQMFVANRKNAVWLINQDIEPFLLTLTLPTGTASGAVVYMPPGGLSGAPYATILGRPVIATEFNQTTGTVGDIILADLSQVLSGTRGGMQSAVSMHVYFETAEQVFRFILRVDARPWWLRALTPKNGTALKSPFIALGART